MTDRIAELEAENKRLREERDYARFLINMYIGDLNSGNIISYFLVEMYAAVDRWQNKE